MGEPVHSVQPEEDAARERRAREFLAAGRHRKARDEIKILCKVNRSQYLPLLIQANQGLIREMLAKGQVPEAQQVLAYLKTIASAEECRGVELEVARKSPDAGSLLDNALLLLSRPDRSMSDMDRRRLADQVILAFQPPPASTPETILLAEQAVGIQRAIQEVCNGKLELAADALRPVPRESPFDHWRWWIKGLIAFHAGQMDKAVQFF